MIHKRIVIGVIAVAAVIAMFVYKNLPVDMQSDAALAHGVVAECAENGTADGQKDLCYEKAIPALMDKGISMERAYAITVIVQDLDPSYHYCHVLAHNISAKETAKDSSKWKDIIARAPAGICGNGALHGAFQERFRSVSLPDASVEEVTGMLRGACDLRPGWAPTLIEQSSCMHGMGHLLLFITEANVQRSLALCEVLANGPSRDFRETCREGIFMQIYQPLEPEDIGLVKKLAPEAKKNRVAFCGRFPEPIFATCIKESWPVLRDRIMTKEGLEAVCTPLTGMEGYDNCFRGATFVVMGMKEYDSKSMLALCSLLTRKNDRDICVARTAERFVETDWRNVPQALAVCAASPESAGPCWDQLTGYAENGMRADSPQTKALCGGMPEPWRAKCLGNTNTHL